ncbi:hypothetical protein Tco_0077837, partial [Tanacetum coccineum]
LNGLLEEQSRRKKTRVELNTNINDDIPSTQQENISQQCPSKKKGNMPQHLLVSDPVVSMKTKVIVEKKVITSLDVQRKSLMRKKRAIERGEAENMLKQAVPNTLYRFSDDCCDNFVMAIISGCFLFELGSVYHLWVSVEFAVIALVDYTKCLDRLAMSSDSASSAVTYTSISSDTNGPSWGILLVNAGELPEMDPYEEVAQQGQTPPLSHAYVPDPMKLEEHVPVYVPEPEHPEYHVPSDDDIQVKDQPYADDASLTAESPGPIADLESMEEDSIDYLDEHEDDEEDSEEDPKEDHTNYPADGEDGDDEPSDDDDDDDDTDDKDEEPIEDEEEEEHLALANSSMVPVVDPVPSAGDTEAFETDEAWKTVRLEPPMSASMEAHIAEHAAAPILPTSSTYDQAPQGHRAAMIPESSAAARPPRGQYDFVDIVEAGQALQAYERRIMTSIEEVSYQAQIDVVRSQRTDYETELHEVRQAHLSFEARNRALLARLETLETHMSRMEWQRQSAEDLAVRQMMCIHVLEARAQIDTVEDTGSSC